MSVSAAGLWTYTPAANYYGADVFGYRVTDDQGASGVGVVEITITPVNDAPVADGDEYTVSEDQTLVVSVAPVSRLHMVSEPGDFIGQGLVWDFNPATAGFAADTNFDNGVEVNVDPPGVVERWDLNFAAPFEVLLTPGAYPGATRFPFQAAGEPGLDVSGYGRGLNRLKGNFTVYDVAYGPAGTVTRFAATFLEQDHNFDDTLEPPLYGAVVFNSTFGAGGGVLGDDTDPEGNLLLGATLVSGPANGTLIWNGDGTFSYTPNLNFHGSDTFTYRTSDGQAQSNVASVTITVSPVNDPPTASDGSLATNEDTPASGQVVATDVDGNPLTYSIVAAPAHGTVNLNPVTAAFTYTPAANYNGPDSFTFRASDGTAESNVATISLTVNPVNDAPTASDGSLATNEDTPASGQVVATDVDGNPLTYSIVAAPAHGTVNLNPVTAAFTYTPAANYNGPDSFTFRASDGAANSNVATISITVQAVNDAPTASDGSLTTAEDTPAGGQLVATDVDGNPLTFSLVAGPEHGTVSLTPSTGAFTYTPAANYNGPDSFTFRAHDGTADSNVAAVSITADAAGRTMRPWQWTTCLRPWRTPRSRSRCPACSAATATSRGTCSRPSWPAAPATARLR